MSMAHATQAARAWQQQREDYESLVRAVFATPAGQALMLHWKTTLLQAPTWMPGDDLATAAHAEGRKAFVRALDAIITPQRLA
jgi:hypothetical protein